MSSLEQGEQRKNLIKDGSVEETPKQFHPYKYFLAEDHGEKKKKIKIFLLF